MSDNFKGFVKDLTVATAVEIVKLLLFLVLSIVVSYITADFISTFYAWLIPYKLHILGLLATISCLLIIGFYQKSGRFQPMFPRLECDFHILKKTIIYEYDSPQKITYRRHFKLRALRNGLTSFTDCYHWTGKDKCKLTCERGGNSIRDGRKRNVWQFYEVTFARTYNKDEIIDIEVRWDLDDIEGKAVPFISATVSDPTDLLVFQIRFIQPYSARDIVGEHSPNMSGKVLKTKELNLINDATEWIVEEPLLLHHYEVRWSPYSNNRVII